MPLDEAQTEIVKKWLESKHASFICPVCSHNTWSPGDLVVAPRFASGSTEIGGQVIPMVQVICTNCSYIRFFAAVPIGLTK